MKINFSDIQSLILKKITSPEVILFAEKNNFKTPLKSSSPSNDRVFSKNKTKDLTLAWSHNIILPDYFPAKKEGRTRVCYITQIYFNKFKISNMPLDILPDDDEKTLMEKVKNHHHVSTLKSGLIKLKLKSDINLFVNLNDDEWYLSCFEYNSLSTINSSIHAHAFSPWESRWSDQDADVPIGMFMAWCIHRGLIGERHLKERPSLVKSVLDKKMTGRAFLYQAAFHNEVWSWDFDPAIEWFAFKYINCLCNRNSSQPLLGKFDRCGPNDDFMAVFGPQTVTGRGLDAADDWNNFDRFAKYIDARYFDWKNTDFKTEIDDPHILKKICDEYTKNQLEMALLPKATERIKVKSDVVRVFNESLTTTLIDFLGKNTDAPDFLEFLTNHQLKLPSVTWLTCVDAPEDGFFIHVNYPWSVQADRISNAITADEKKRRQRKKLKIIETIEFCMEIYEHIGNSTGNYLHVSPYTKPLPFGLIFGQSLQQLDARWGPDELEYAADDDDDDDEMIRRWHIQHDGNLHTGSEDIAHLVLLAIFSNMKLIRIEIKIA
jgi:hypothetical protein